MTNAVLPLIDADLVDLHPALRDLVVEQGAHHTEDTSLGLPPLSEASCLAQESFLRTKNGLGRASAVLLRGQTEWLLRWAQTKHDPGRSDFGFFTSKLLHNKWQAFVRQVGAAHLAREFCDQQQRDLASREQGELAVYLRSWRKRLRQMQLVSPGHWYVPGLQDKELVDLLELELLEAVRKPGAFDFYERSGQEATFRLLASRKDRLRQRRKMYEVLPSLQQEDLAEHFPSPEQFLLNHEKEALLEQAVSVPDISLSKPQQIWLRAFREEVVAHGLKNGGRINNARVAYKLKKEPSSAGRALLALRQKLRNSRACEVLRP